MDSYKIFGQKYGVPSQICGKSATLPLTKPPLGGILSSLQLLMLSCMYTPAKCSIELNMADYAVIKG